MKNTPIIKTIPTSAIIELDVGYNVGRSRRQEALDTFALLQANSTSPRYAFLKPYKVKKKNK